MEKDITLCIIGLGYVGLPLAVEFGLVGFRVIGFDTDEKKISELKRGVDRMGEVENTKITKSKVDFTSQAKKLTTSDITIIAVPTPVTATNLPDMSLLYEASKIVGKQMKKGSVIVYESTVYPGATEEECVPILEKESGLKFGEDFTVGYSPERVTPGDKNHTIPKIVKVVSGSNKKTLELLSRLYSSIVKAGIHKAPNIKTAETCKVIENCQRDLNIALMNELSLICEKLGIQTMDVIDASTTKWNIHRYTPGLVGGHCIGVDPYYLVHKAQQLGVRPQVITAGRRINDSMPKHVAQMVVKGLIEANRPVKGARVLVLGLTFKENVRDTRNSKITKTIEELQRLKIDVIGFDPLLEETDLHEFPPIKFLNILPDDLRVDAVLLSVGHNQFRDLIRKRIAKFFGGQKAVLVDVRSFFPQTIVGPKGIYKNL